MNEPNFHDQHRLNDGPALLRFHIVDCLHHFPMDQFIA
jgi:hypothetical protein